MKRKSVRDKDNDDDTITTVSWSWSRREIVVEIIIKARSWFHDVIKEVITFLSWDFNYKIINVTR